MKNVKRSNLESRFIFLFILYFNEFHADLVSVGCSWDRGILRIKIDKKEPQFIEIVDWRSYCLY